MKRYFAVFTILALSIVAVFASERQNPKDFTLKPIFGKEEFKLSEAKGKYVALQFLLKTECPICQRHTRSFLETRDKHPDVIQVFIKPDTQKEIKEWATFMDFSDPEKKLEIYHDPGASLAKKFGIPDGYKFHGQEVHYPAFILLNPEGKEVFRFVGKNNRERFTYEQFKEKLAELKSS